MKSLKFRIFNGLITLIAGVLLYACKPSVSTEYVDSENIFINQVLYGVNETKSALIKDYQGSFEIISLKNNRTVYKGETTSLTNWEYSGEDYSIANFSPLKEKGTYTLLLTNKERSGNFKIGDNSEYSKLCKAGIKSLYFLRSGFEVEPKYGGKWARKSGHPDTNVIVHSSAVNSTLKPGSIISSPGGWYDAGDYNKYIVNSATTVFTMLTAYNSFPDFFNGLSLNIPESNNNIPDILDEVIYNIRWMLTMQDKDGGVYHKLTTLSFDGFIMPEEAKMPRYVVMKSTSATLDFVSSMAAASRIFETVEGLKPLADSCIIAAENAWKWAADNDGIFYVQPEDISTGIYPDTNHSDNWMWASFEMFLATKDTKYLSEKKVFGLEFPFTTPSWDLVNTFGLISIISNPDAFEKDFYTRAKKAFISLVDDLYSIYSESPVNMSLNYFKWGSNSDIANQAMLGFLAYQNTKEEKYAEMASENLDYLLGRNPMSYCFVTGFGTKSPMKIHQRSSGADGVEEPIPGFLVGGPNIDLLNDCKGKFKRSDFPGISYIDEECSYSTNEIAINWNPPLVYCAAAIAELRD